MYPPLYRLTSLFLLFLFLNSGKLTAQPCQLLVRPSISGYTQAQMDTLTKAILDMKFRPSAFNPAYNAYDYFVVLHFEASTDHASAAHHSPGFTAWHRELLLRFEHELRLSTNRPDYMLPYWDWLDQTAFTKIFSANAFGGNGFPPDGFVVQNGRFGKSAGMFKLNYYPISIPDTAYSPFIKRHFGWLPTVNTLPKPSDIDVMMSKTSYDVSPWDYYADTAVSFRNYLEGFWNGPDADPRIAHLGDGNHGRVHIFVGGNMVSKSSPNDPVFFLHHANVDRLWAMWQDMRGLNNFTEEWEVIDGDIHYFTQNDTMYGFDVSYADRFDVRALCYRYDTQAAVGSAAVAGPVEELRVYPNPVSGQLHFQIGSPEAETYRVAVFSSPGVVVWEGWWPNSAGEAVGRIAMDNLQAGVYYLEISGKGGKTITRFVLSP